MQRSGGVGGGQKVRTPVVHLSHGTRRMALVMVSGALRGWRMTGTATWPGDRGAVPAQTVQGSGASASSR